MTGVGVWTAEPSSVIQLDACLQACKWQGRAGSKS